MWQEIKRYHLTNAAWCCYGRHFSIAISHTQEISQIQSKQDYRTSTVNSTQALGLKKLLEVPGCLSSLVVLNRVL